MGNGRSRSSQPAGDDGGPLAAITAAIRELAYATWASYREEGQDTSRTIFERAYLGHYSTLDAYVSQLIDDYDLDAKLDAAIAEPFRHHVDIDVTALGRALIARTTLYTLQAVPVGVWVFNGDIE
jgi:hypothetical protein